MIFKVKYKLHRMKPDNSGEEVKEVMQQVSIPVQTDGKAFVVNGLPQVVKSMKATVKETEDEREEVKDVKAKQRFVSFTNIFQIVYNRNAKRTGICT